MKLAVVVALVLGTYACGGKKSSSSSTTPTMNATGGTPYGGNAYGGSRYGTGVR